MGENEKSNLAYIIASMFCMTKQVESIFDKIDLCRLPENREHYIFTGPGGIGKTSALIEYTYNEKNKPHVLFSNEVEIEKIPVMYMNISSAYTLKALLQSIIDATRETFRISYSIEKHIQQINILFKEKGVEALILDDVQEIIFSRYHTPYDVLDTLIDIANITNVSLILCGLPEIEKVMESDIKYGRVFRPMNLNPYIFDDEFVEMLKSIEEQIDAPFPLGFSDLKSEIPQLLFKASKGYIGRLKSIILEAFRQIGLFEDKIELSQMKMSQDVVTKACEKVSEYWSNMEK